MQMTSNDIEQGDPKLKNVQVILTEEIIVRLDSEARKRTMNRSLLIRMACEKFLNGGVAA